MKDNLQSPFSSRLTENLEIKPAYKYPQYKDENRRMRLTLPLIWKAVTCRYANPEQNINLYFLYLVVELLSVNLTFSSAASNEFYIFGNSLDSSGIWLYFHGTAFFLILGHIASYINRGAPNCLVKLGITGWLLFALGSFLSSLAENPVETKAPLMLLLCRMLVGHSYDTPRTKDLDYSLLVSIMLAASSVALDNDMKMGLLLLSYILAAGCLLIYRTRCISRAGRTIVRSGRQESAAGIFFSTPFFVCSATGMLFAMYLVIYTPGETLVHVDNNFQSISLFNSSNRNSDEAETENFVRSLLNRGRKMLDLAQIDDSQMSIVDTESDIAGENSRELILQIKTSQPCSYLRQTSLCDYDGRNWSRENLEPLPGDENEPEDAFKDRHMRFISSREPLPLGFRPRSRHRHGPRENFPHHGHSRQSVREFKDWHPLSAVVSIKSRVGDWIPLPYMSRRLLFPDNTLQMAEDRSLKAQMPLEDGITYQIRGFTGSLMTMGLNPEENFIDVKDRAQINERIISQKEAARKAAGFKGAFKVPKSRYSYSGEPYNYLDLPDSVPGRVQKLAELLTKNCEDDIAKAGALRGFIRTNCVYDYVNEKIPADRESTDYYLFSSRRGNCRIAASAMAVMCRSIGVPSRVVLGYAPNVYNPILKVYEVRGVGHAWCEIRVPRLGWVPFDATPSSSDSIESIRQRGTIAQLYSYILGTHTDAEFEQLAQNCRRAAKIAAAAVFLLCLVIIIHRRRQIADAAVLHFSAIKTAAADVRAAGAGPSRWGAALRMALAAARTGHAGAAYPEEAAWSQALLCLAELDLKPEDGQTALAFSGALPDRLRNLVLPLARARESRRWSGPQSADTAAPGPDCADALRRLRQELLRGTRS